VYRDYSPKGVQFFYLYKALAHPEHLGYVRPVTLGERLMHIKEAERTLGSGITWICDTMSNDLKHAIGNAPNSEYVLDPEGKIFVKRAWSDPEELRKDLERLVGPVEKPTSVADLDMKVADPPREAPVGIVPRPTVPGNMKALRLSPQLEKSRHPFYVKARVEASAEFVEGGRGMLYLGFHLDPLYGVHWNNLVAPLQFELFPPDGVIVSPSKASGPKVKAETDADPREFLLVADRGGSDEPMRLSVRYFACTDKACFPVTQEYLIHWDVDEDGGRPNRRPRSERGRPAEAGSPGSMVERMMSRDANGDGKLSRDELPTRVQRRFDRMDTNGDGFVDQAELKETAQRIRSQRRPE